MKTTLSLAALALAAALLALPTAPQAATLKLDGLHQDKPVHAIAAKKHKKKVASRKSKKHYAKKHGKKRVVSHRKKKPSKAAKA
jgi:hypothetical protein